ncbi:unnamed protein product [Chondrus crispus]|uniref:Uncharacterized protein n=1 Tax=Chondrus crispus TaxID=2769 RepID=R7Q9X7_CHOCR|nr:unnamed protein product [Chondrus crispus]CDF34275.1 unnamed protein product [Chondrus crispus]|eukprot:XP_005714094.1 unnamed protein product [Chondrus crispus]
MKSLSSEATKPQLARRVARPSKSSSTTPPLTTASDDAAPPELVKLLVADSARGASPNFTTPAMTNIAAAEPVAGITPRLREAPIDTKDAYMRSIRSIYGNVDCDLPSRRSDSATGPVGRKNTDASAPTSQPQQISRRLDEAFKAPTPAAPSRYEGKRNPPPVTSRKDQIGALRRSSAPSPPPRVSGGSRKTNGRESSSTPVKNGRKASMAESPVDVPPGFESRTSAVSRGAFLGRGKTDSDVGSGSKSTERERDPVLPRPSNSRADAFREAINTRRQSVSPRSTSSRRTKTPDSKGESPHDSSNGRLSMAKEDWRLRNGDKEPSRQVTSASKLPSGVLGALQQEKERSRRKSDIATLLRPEEKIMRRRLERTTEAPVATAVSVDSGSTTKTRNALPLKTNRTDSMTNPSVAHGGQVEEFNPKMSEDRFTTLKAPKDRGVFAGNGNINPRRPSKLVPEDSRKSNDHPIGHPMLESRQVNGWANGSPEVIDGVAEACVNSLLENEDDYVPPSSLPGVSGTAPALPSNGPSMIDMMRACHANEPSSSVLSTSDRQEDVLPPLPNPEEDVRFETMLRSMGWSPPEEDETIRYHRNGISLHSDQDPSRSNSSLPEMVGIRQAENGDVRSGYYSHFH